MFHFSLGWTSLVHRFLGPKQAQKVLLGLADPNIQVSASDQADMKALFYTDETILGFIVFALTIYVLAACLPPVPSCEVFMVRDVFIGLYSGLEWNKKNFPKLSSAVT